MPSNDSLHSKNPDPSEEGITELQSKAIGHGSSTPNTIRVSSNPLNLPRQPRPPQTFRPSLGERIRQVGFAVVGLGLAFTSYHAVAGYAESDNLTYCAQVGPTNKTHLAPDICRQAFEINHNGIANDDSKIYQLPGYDDHIIPFLEGLGAMVIGAGLIHRGKILDTRISQRPFGRQ